MKNIRLLSIIGVAAVAAVSAQASVPAILSRLIINKGFLTQGNLSSLLANDANVMKVQGLFGRNMSWEVRGGIHVSPNDVRRIFIVVVAKKTATMPVRVSLFNFQTNQYSPVGAINVPSATFGLVGLNVISNPGRFVRSGGEFRLRFDGFAAGTMTTNLVRILVN